MGLLDPGAAFGNLLLANGPSLRGLLLDPRPALKAGLPASVALLAGSPLDIGAAFGALCPALRFSAFGFLGAL